MKEWPEFFRHRELGWLSLGFIRTSIVSGIKGGIAEIMRRLWRIFFCGDDLGFSFPIVVGVPWRMADFILCKVIVATSLLNN